MPAAEPRHGLSGEGGHGVAREGPAALDGEHRDEDEAERGGLDEPREQREGRADGEPAPPAAALLDRAVDVRARRPSTMTGRKHTGFAAAPASQANVPFVA